MLLLPPSLALFPPLALLLPAQTAAVAAAGSKAMDCGALRFLNLHEYQSKDLLESYGAQVQKGRAAHSAKEAGEVARWIRKDSE